MHGVHNLKKGIALSQVEPELKIHRNRTFSLESGCIETQGLRKQDYNFEDDEPGESWTYWGLEALATCTLENMGLKMSLLL